MTHPRRREGFAERRARRAAIDDPGVVFDAALRFLEARARSAAEVTRHLATAGYRADLVEGAVGRLTGLHLLDDDAFARSWVASRDRAHPRGERALRLELRQKGLAEADIAAALASRGEPDPLLGPSEEPSLEPDESAARRLLAKRRAALEREPDLRARRAKAYGLLARSGFASELAGRLAAELVASRYADVDDDEAIDSGE